MITELGLSSLTSPLPAGSAKFCQEGEPERNWTAAQREQDLALCYLLFSSGLPQQLVPIADSLVFIFSLTPGISLTALPERQQQSWPISLPQKPEAQL